MGVSTATASRFWQGTSGAKGEGAGTCGEPVDCYMFTFWQGTYGANPCLALKVGSLN